MDEDIKALLEEILSWMTDNDYECGRAGSVLYERISAKLKASE